MIARGVAHGRGEPALQHRGSVVIVHDYLTQRGGAERVVLAMLQVFPHARVITSVYEPETTFPEFAAYDVETLWVNRISPLRRDPRRALPLLARAFSDVEVRGAEAVLCSSSGWSHGVRTFAPKVVYCHNPARWLFQREDYLREHGRAARLVLGALTPSLRRWDRRAAASATRYLTNSTIVQKRVRDAYGIEATVIPPPITIDYAGTQEPVPGIEPGFLLTVSRPRAYKNRSVVCEAVESLPEQRLVVVGGLPAPRGGGTWSTRLRGVSGVTDSQLRWLYANCSAVIAASHEDFGLTPLEGNAFGRPAVVLRAGGFLDTLREGETGVYVEACTPAAVRSAIQQCVSVGLPEERMRYHAAEYRVGVFGAALTKALQEARSTLYGARRPDARSQGGNPPAQPRGRLAAPTAVMAAPAAHK